jgi:hypothetical protein
MGDNSAITVRAFLSVVFVALTSCLEITTGSDAGTRNATATDAAGVTQNPASGATGTNCVDFGSGVVLCTTTSLCPNVAVDHDLYPNCGFRVPSSSIDLECACDNMLCPMGSALGCSQALDLMASQSELTVCAQSNEGRCAALTTQPTVGSCDRSCAATCVSDPLCLRLCGC